MNPIKTALIVLDPQNDLTSSTGKLFPATQPVLDKFDVINNINQLTDSFRYAGATIIYSPIVFSKGYPEVGNTPYGVMASVIANEAMVKGTSGAEISQQFTMKDEDIILERSAIIAFEGTNLTQILKDKGITTIILCGLLSDICVEGTMRTAYSKGFEVFTLIDATATLSLEKQEITAEHSYPLFSKVIKTEELLSLIKR
ncbi:MAG: cysteine hydrolase [Colwellia sp.]|nr:cysteine hydrolase [Colwellia sp.]